MKPIVNLTRWAKKNAYECEPVNQFLDAIKNEELRTEDIDIYLYQNKCSTYKYDSFDYYVAKGNLMLIFKDDVERNRFFADLNDCKFYKSETYDMYYLYDDTFFDICEGNEEPYKDNEIHEIDGHKYSDDWLSDSDDYFICQHCDEWHHVDDECCVNVEGYEESWCTDCCEDHATCCEDCGEYFATNEMYSINDGSYYVCRSCRDRGDYRQCDDCGGWYEWDRMSEGDDGYYYCEDCIDNHHNDSNIRSYHDNPSLVFHTHKDDKGEDGICYKYIGTEVETECGDVEERERFTVDFGQSEEYIYQMHDGSLDDETGIECITQPMSYHFWKEFDFEGWMHGLARLGARSHETDSCGLHVHLSREWINDADKNDEYQLAIVGRIRQFLADNSEVVKRFARRGEERWCAYSKPFKDKSELHGLSSTDRDKKFAEKAKGVCDRYQALNNNNDNTIEFRIFRGTLNPETYRASVEFCLRVVDYIKSHSDMAVNWEDFLTYKPLPECMVNYMKRRFMAIPNVE